MEIRKIILCKTDSVAKILKYVDNYNIKFQKMIVDYNILYSTNINDIRYADKMKCTKKDFLLVLDNMSCEGCGKINGQTDNQFLRCVYCCGSICIDCFRELYGTNEYACC